MTALYSVRWALILGLGYLLLSLGIFAADAVGGLAENSRELKRIVQWVRP